MIQENFEQNQPLEKIFKNLQFQQIIKAIITGNYSWACVLFLHFSGYNPQDYIPRETYNKLIQENYVLTETNYPLNDDKKVRFSEIKLNLIKSNNSKFDSN
jgi:hypothetical protein